jgi:hypothetical protein
MSGCGAPCVRPQSLGRPRHPASSSAAPWRRRHLTGPLICRDDFLFVLACSAGRLGLSGVASSCSARACVFVLGLVACAPPARPPAAALGRRCRCVVTISPRDALRSARGRAARPVAPRDAGVSCGARACARPLGPGRPRAPSEARRRPWAPVPLCCHYLPSGRPPPRLRARRAARGAAWRRGVVRRQGLRATAQPRAPARLQRAPPPPLGAGAAAWALSPVGAPSAAPAGAPAARGAAWRRGVVRRQGPRAPVRPRAPARPQRGPPPPLGAGAAVLSLSPVGTPSAAPAGSPRGPWRRVAPGCRAAPGPACARAAPGARAPPARPAAALGRRRRCVGTISRLDALRRARGRAARLPRELARARVFSQGAGAPPPSRATAAPPAGPGLRLRAPAPLRRVRLCPGPCAQRSRARLSARGALWRRGVMWCKGLLAPARHGCFVVCESGSARSAACAPPAKRASS